jgi:dsDNA-binding SOS-regulon protein
MTEHIPNVLPYIKELKETWRRQDFTFSKQQQEEYDLLLATRRERVKQFYATDRVCKVSKSAQDKLKDED